MQSVELSGLEKLDSDLSRIFDEIPEARRELHERLAELTKAEVDAQIAASGINDAGGRVRSWQDPSVGSGGGYAAVRAVKGETGPNSPGAITNYLENGHRTRPASGNVKRQRRGRAKTAYVDGYHFYEAARTSIESKSIAEAERFADELAERLGGGL